MSTGPVSQYNESINSLYFNESKIPFIQSILDSSLAPLILSLNNAIQCEIQ